MAAAVILLVCSPRIALAQSKRLPAPWVETDRAVTQSDVFLIRGHAPGAARVEIAGSAHTEQVAVRDGQFESEVPLRRNRTNRFSLTSVNQRGVRSAARVISITQDREPPDLIIDYPQRDCAITSDAVDVVGRVRDAGGGEPPTVEVNGVKAVVHMHREGLGTFCASAVPVRARTNGPAGLTITGHDALGNVVHQLSRLHVQAMRSWIEVVGGSGQTATVMEPLSNPIRVRVWKSPGVPFANKLVTFTVTRSDGRVAADSSTAPGAITLQVFTDTSGIATAYWTLGGAAGAGNNVVVATSEGMGGQAVVVASATPGAIQKIGVSAGDAQRVQTDAPAAEPLVAWVNDGCNGIAGVPVTFRVTAGSGTVDGGNEVTIPTDDSGHASATFVTGPEPGNQLVEANYEGNAGLPATFVVHAVAATGPATRFEGVVVDHANQPIRNVGCTLVVGAWQSSVMTDIDGHFLIDDIAGSGLGKLSIQGSSGDFVGGPDGAPVPPGTFPDASFEPIVVANATNTLPSPVILPRLDPANRRDYDTTQDVVLECAGVEGLMLVVKAGTTVTLPDGTEASPERPVTLSVDQVHFDQLRVPVGDGAGPALAWTVEPEGTTFEPPMVLQQPNLLGLPPGAWVNLLQLDPELGRFTAVGMMRVSTDGLVIESEDPTVNLFGGGQEESVSTRVICPPYGPRQASQQCRSEPARRHRFRRLPDVGRPGARGFSARRHRRIQRRRR
ncbi:MAG: hypothetical protein U1E76_21965 [Planctomycetota bacterium]